MTFLDLALAVLGLSLALALARVILGPTAPDRAMALEAAGVHLVAIMGVWSVRARGDFFDAMLVLAAVSFVGTLVLDDYHGTWSPIDGDRLSTQYPHTCLLDALVCP